MGRSTRVSSSASRAERGGKIQPVTANGFLGKQWRFREGHEYDCGDVRLMVLCYEPCAMYLGDEMGAFSAPLSAAVALGDWPLRSEVAAGTGEAV